MTTSNIDTRHGLMRIINEDIWVSRALRELGEHSPGELNLMQMILGLASHGRYDGVIIDAGAYIGDFTIPLARMCKRLYAFEPHAETREILRYNLTLNHITNVEVLPYALGDKEEVVKYASSSGEESPGSTQMGLPDGDCTAQMVSLDSLDITPDLIKADIEGMEIPMLAGAMRTLRECSPALFLEYDTVIQPSMRPLHECMELIGYKPYPMSFSMWTPDNWRGAPNTFGTTVSKMMLGVRAPVGVHANHTA